MPAFTKGPDFRTPFARNQWLRSTQDILFDSAMCAAATVPSVTIDGVAQKVLQPGVVMAKITSGDDVGKVGPYDPSGTVTDGRQTYTNIVGVNNTFLPWQLLHRDVEIAVAYDAVAVQAWCLCYDADDEVWVALDDTTAGHMVAQKSVDITFRPRASDVV